MLTDEELAELEAAVDSTESVLGRTCSAVTLEWFINSLRWLLTLWRFGRDAIARERAMRQPLTAEICERLGMIGELVCHDLAYRLNGTNILANVYEDDVTALILKTECIDVTLSFESDGKPLTVGHLFAAAKLAGVALDWRKVGE